MSTVDQRRRPALHVVDSENEIDGLREDRPTPEQVVVHALTSEIKLRDAQRLRRVQLVTDASLARLRLDDLLPALLERTQALLEVDTVAILLLDAESGELVARAAVGIEEEVEQRVRIPLGAGFAGRIAAERQPLFLPDVDQEDVLNPLLREKGIKSLLGVPLLVEGEASGVLHVGSLTPRVFEQDEVELLRLVADRAAVAIEHARLFEAERQARERLEQVQAVTDVALALLDLDELLGELLHRIRAILGSDTAAILLLDVERRELVARAAVGIEEEVEQGVRIPLGAGFAGRIAAERKPLFLPNIGQANVLNPLLREKGITSLLGVPLLAHGDVLVVLHVCTLAQRDFGSDEIELLQMVAERAALAIEKARLHRELVEVDELRANFVAFASHELRTPASSVFGVLATLHGRGDELPEAQRRQLVEVGYEQGARLTRLLEQLLDLSRLDARAIALKPRPLVLRSVLIETLSNSSVDPGIVRLEVPADLTIVADPIVLERVVSNLLVNAEQHGTPPVVVAAEQRDGHLLISVEDAGPGIPDELRPRIFERFGRGDDAHGRGLGLTIARASAYAHGGDLVYQPRARGTRFELVLPRS
jgi:signal transduction histidine kinase